VTIHDPLPDPFDDPRRPPDRPPEVVPLPTTVHVVPWDDPIVDRRGHDPRSAYVEQFWLSVLGPTATWLLRRLVAGFDERPDGYQLDVADAARSLGLSVTKGMASPFAKALQRCVMFGVANRLSERWVVRRRIPTVSQRHLLRLPPALQSAHERWTRTTIDLHALERAHALAAAMIAAGDDRGVLEPQLVAIGVPGPTAAEASHLALRAARGER